ncbi:MAG: hypothetical protein ACTSUE_09935 [Promethearchaeota archaeon]
MMKLVSLTSLLNDAYVIPLFIIGFLFLLILYKKNKERKISGAGLPVSDEEIESLANPVAITVILFVTLIYTTFLSEIPVMVTPLNIITLAWYGLFLLVFYRICRREKMKYPEPLKEDKEEEELELKFEIIRKITHFVIALILLMYVVLGPLFIEFINLVMSWIPFFGQNAINADPSQYGQYAVVFFLIISFLGLSTSEIVRVFFYNAYPLKAVKAIYRKKEIGAALGSHISLTVGCMSVIMIFGPYYPDIVVASVSVSAIGDAAANIVGKKFGTHEFKTAFSRKRKTIEGLISAVIVSFVLSFLFLIYRFGPYSFLLAFVAAGVIIVIDWLSIQVSDNLLNPVLTSIAMVLIAQIIP